MTPEEFIDWLGPVAADICHRWNLPASVLIAQGALESGWGEYTIGDYNLFGRKYNGKGNHIDVDTYEWEGDHYELHKEVPFQDYDSLEEACIDWCVLMSMEPLYETAYHYWSDTLDLEGFVHRLAPVYATDPDYAFKVLSTIRANNLEEFDDYSFDNN